MGKKINYTEGDCFSIPLRDGGFARGVVARMDGNGIIFGYFLGLKYLSFQIFMLTTYAQTKQFFWSVL